MSRVWGYAKIDGRYQLRGRRSNDSARAREPRAAPCGWGEAGGRVAAGFDFASVRVEDAHLHVRRLRRLDEDELVAADARLAVGNMAGPRAIHLQWRFARVEDSEIVAETMHFVKAAISRPLVQNRSGSFRERGC